MNIIWDILINYQSSIINKSLLIVKISLMSIIREVSGQHHLKTQVITKPSKRRKENRLLYKNQHWAAVGLEQGWSEIAHWHPDGLTHLLADL